MQYQLNCIRFQPALGHQLKVLEDIDITSHPVNAADVPAMKLKTLR